MNKLLFARIHGRLTAALWDGTRFLQLDAEEEEPSILGNIYIAKVKNVVKNINSAFVDLGGGRMAYYSLQDGPCHFAGDTRRSVPQAGDDLVVQVVREAVKTKDPVVSGKLSFTGRFCVLTAGRNQIGFSAKIRDAGRRRQLQALLEPEMEEDFGVIVRTNAQDAPEERILEELRFLKEQYRQVLAASRFRVSGSLLYEAEPFCRARLRDVYGQDLEAIVTDQPDIYEDLREYLSRHQPEALPLLRLYQDPLVSLDKVYQLEKALDEALSPRVWLKSGGYLVIEPTEALTVIDVNTGKYAGKKNQQETIKKINLEAARETARQLRLRNLSGIILVDFIDMETAKDQEELLSVLSACCFQDPIRTTVVDMTRLNLVELTRKKVRKPLYEQIGRRRQK